MTPAFLVRMDDVRPGERRRFSFEYLIDEAGNVEILQEEGAEVSIAPTPATGGTR